MVRGSNPLAPAYAFSLTIVKSTFKIGQSARIELRGPARKSAKNGPTFRTFSGIRFGLDVAAHVPVSPGPEKGSGAFSFFRRIYGYCFEVQIRPDRKKASISELFLDEGGP